MNLRVSQKSLNTTRERAVAAEQKGIDSEGTFTEQKKKLNERI